MFVLPRSFLLALRSEGLRLTASLVWTRVFGHEEYLVFVRHLVPPREAVVLPVEIKGAVVHAMREADLEAVARLIPFSLSRMPLAERRASLRCCWPESVVARRGDRIVGAVWYVDSVGPEQPFYPLIEPYVRPPARLTAGVFVAPNENVGAWGLVHVASQRLAHLGVRTTVSAVRSDNKPSMIMARMQHATLTAKVSIHYFFGRRSTRVEPASGRGPI